MPPRGGRHDADRWSDPPRSSTLPRFRDRARMRAAASRHGGCPPGTGGRHAAERARRPRLDPGHVLQHPVRRRRDRSRRSRQSLVSEPGRLPGQSGSDRRSDPGGSRRRRRTPGGNRQRLPDRRRPRLVLCSTPPGHQPVPVDRSARRRRLVRLRRSDVRSDDRGGERPPDIGPVRSVLPAPGVDAPARPRSRGRPADARHHRPARASAGARGGRRPRRADRRLQLAVAPRLDDGCLPRSPGRRPLPDRLAGRTRPGQRRVP